MATRVRKTCSLVSRERRSLWLGPTVNEGSLTTEHCGAFDVGALKDIVLATDFVLTELQKLTETPLFAVELRLNGGDIRRLDARTSTKKAMSGSGLDGGRHRDRTCDPSRVKGVLYR